ncbi:MFS transporter [Leifsonia sp. YAF41]|uniref:MFS transporter n=1 Tax=Leifsonia sp. YAF41 TaxID=3233086 RepID=UPI003F95F436
MSSSPLTAPVAVASVADSAAFPDSASPGPEPRLPIGGLLALAAVVFLAVLTEILPAGLLPQMSAALQVSESQIGQLVTVYALATALTAIPLIALTRGIPRRTLLLVLVIGFALVNVVTAVSSSYSVILIARVGGGVLAGLLWAMMAGYAMRMVPPAQAGKALALAMVGTPLAFALGLPLGTLLGTLLGWRMIFGLIAVVTALLVIWVLLTVPQFAGERAGGRATLWQVFRTPGLAAILAVTLTFVLAHNVTYTYIAPLMRASGWSDHLDVALLVFGVSAIAGIGLVGMLIDRHLRPLVLLATAVLAVATLVIGVAGSNPIITIIAVGLWGLAYGGAPALLQNAPARVTGEAADVAQSMVVTVWNGAIAAGAFLGGVALDLGGVGALPYVAGAIALVSLLLAFAARTGFAARTRQF